MTQRESNGGAIVLLFFVALFACAGVGGCMFGYPQYRVYLRRLEGEGILAEGEASKKVIIETAKAEAEAEKIRSGATVEAIKTVGESLSRYPEYTRHRFIEGLHDEKTEVIYLPIGQDGLPQMFNHPLRDLPRNEQLPLRSEGP